MVHYVLVKRSDAPPKTRYEAAEKADALAALAQLRRQYGAASYDLIAVGDDGEAAAIEARAVRLNDQGAESPLRGDDIDPTTRA